MQLTWLTWFDPESIDTFIILPKTAGDWTINGIIAD